jgi:hypothetical protein
LRNLRLACRRFFIATTLRDHLLQFGGTMMALLNATVGDRGGGSCWTHHEECYERIEASQLPDAIDDSIENDAEWSS